MTKLEQELQGAKMSIRLGNKACAISCLRSALSEANKMKHNAAKSKILTAMNYLRVV